ncbi:MAG: flagellar export chaperone FliS [Alphaproteobacteria bacterium]
MTQEATRTYRLQSVLTVSPARQVALLYDRTISSLKEAIHAIEEGDIERRWKANNRAIEIIGQLSLALDHDAGGEFAETLERLYRFMLMRLPNVDIANDPQPARDVIGLIEPLRRSWHELADRLAAEARSGEQADHAPASALPATDATSRVSVSA